MKILITPKFPCASVVPTPQATTDLLSFTIAFLHFLEFYVNGPMYFFWGGGVGFSLRLIIHTVTCTQFLFITE